MARAWQTKSIMLVGTSVKDTRVLEDMCRRAVEAMATKHYRPLCAIEVHRLETGNLHAHIELSVPAGDWIRWRNCLAGVGLNLLAWSPVRRRVLGC